MKFLRSASNPNVNINTAMGGLYITGGLLIATRRLYGILAVFVTVVTMRVFLCRHLMLQEAKVKG